MNLQVGYTGVYGPRFTFSGIDPLAAAFFAAETAAGQTLSPTEKNAIIGLCPTLRSIGLSKFKVLYPIVGTTAIAQSFNLIDPSLFQITWVGSLTHDSTGVTGDGSTGYGDTGWIPSSLASNAEGGLFYYSRSSGDSIGFSMGALTIDARMTVFGPAGGNIFADIWDRLAAGEISIPAATGARGFISANRATTSLLKGYRNGSPLVTNTGDESAGVLPVNSVFVCGANDGGVPLLLSADNFAMFGIKLGLTDTDESNLFTAVQAFETTLGRQV